MRSPRASSCRRQRRLALVAVCCAIALAAGACAPRAKPGPYVVPRSARALPALSTRANAHGRDAGNSARVGDRIVWLFGDTFSGEELICATAAWSEPATPTELEEATDAAGVPLALYPYTAAELRYNREHEEPPACCLDWRGCPAENPYCACPPATDCATRIALWPGDVIDVGGGTAINYYEKIRVAVAPYDFVHLGTGIAYIDEGATVARRELGDDGEARMVFSADEPNFLLALEVADPDGEWVYAYAVTNRDDCRVDVLLARVPLAEATERSAYRFWDGDGWSARLADAEPVLAGVIGGLGSVAWNHYLDAYLGGFSDVCTGGSKFHLRTAPRPEGPWSRPAIVDLSAFGARSDAYAGRLHPALGTGARIVVSFYQPDVVDDEVVGRIHLVSLRVAGSGRRSARRSILARLR